MDIILDMKFFFLSSVCFCLVPTDVSWAYIFSFVHAGNCIGIFFGKMAPVTAIMDAIYSLFSVMDNSLLYASGNSLEYKIEDHITFALKHAR